MPLSPDWFESIREEAGAENMKAPTEEQLRDPDYWRLVAPEWATSYGLSGVSKTPIWFNDARYQYWETGAIFSFGSGSFQLRDVKEKATRPTKPEPQAWDGEGLPPVGCECEYRIGGGDIEWYPCKVQYVLASDPDPDADGWKAVIWCPHLEKDQVAHLPRFQFRPLRTEEQRDTEDLARALLDDLDVLGVNVGGKIATALAIGIKNRGWRKDSA